MKENIYYRYNFYTLEQKVREKEFIDILEADSLLKCSIESFLKTIVDSLYSVVADGITINSSDIKSIDEDEINNHIYSTNH
ncbi:hypothetical protein EZS27_028311 [termite gut metagenome]|uniref:Uncharacterized protein n=1 Tax=termite gut metagenome TaxID=433724 RepID=A0A5J4QL27_9ZZZZ